MYAIVSLHFEMQSVYPRHEHMTRMYVCHFAVDVRRTEIDVAFINSLNLRVANEYRLKLINEVVD